ncbi:MAG TPA: hypothetical protein VGC76_12220 [Pyrinomonadaceae bacterium]
MKKVILLLSVVFCFSAIAYAQPRPVENRPQSTTKNTSLTSVTAKYEGGMFGYSKKEEGTLKLDNESQRLVFYGEDKKEKFAIPYKAIVVIYPSERKVQSGTGRAISAVPIFGAGIGGSLLKKKKHYLVIQFDDPDVDAKGAANFLIDTDELLDSVTQTLGKEASLTQRGDAYYRPREVPKAIL